MYGLIDVGGGMRGIFGAGVCDYCNDNHIHFDYVIGVSAGAANVTSYMANQPGRNVRYYVDYSTRKDYMSIRNFFKTGSFLGLDYIYGTLSNSDGEDPLDYDNAVKSGVKLCVVATDALTGKPVYFGNDDIRKDDYGIIKGSSCIPGIDKPYEYRGRKLFDGGVSNPIPVDRAFDEGCEKVVVVLTRPRDYYRNPKKDLLMARYVKRKYPNMEKSIATRGEVYNRELDLCKEYEKEGKVLIIAPDSIGEMKTLTTDRDVQMRMYEKGRKEAGKIAPFLGIEI